MSGYSLRLEQQGVTVVKRGECALGATTLTHTCPVRLRLSSTIAWGTSGHGERRGTWQTWRVQRCSGSSQ